ncbi:maleylpyruvate isomerase family mycothiol-dependent enzyme [Actinomadura fibrosa]|uniref:Maleylpyruvate isomerase family mycothiol-dependent enzyme n=1 Tax=Actinomadura fibrosa TaxID=111802 RepID=A0ABW2Y105_9ACTN|nr:maleylpyruvate isomerase family mycothiol-dependent enzyme [Actinomadura fibrosa]
MPADENECTVAGFEPGALLCKIIAATDRLISGVDGLGDGDMRVPSLLPGWTRGHVLTHVARNADGGTRLLTWARTGEPAREYASLATRAAEIEDGAGRGAAELVADVRISAGRFADAYARMPAHAWQRTVEWTTGKRRPAHRIADARLCEVLVHHVDLGVGFTPADWPADFVADQLAIVTAAFSAREDAPAMRIHATDTGARYDIPGGGPVVRGRQASLLAWLMGRSAGADLDADGGVLPAPPFLY